MDSKIFEQIQKTDARVFAFGAIAFLALFGPVMIEIFIADPILFKELSISKLILLAIGASLPIAALNTILSIAATKQSTAVSLHLDSAIGLFVTAFIFYINLGIQFLAGYSFHTFVIVGMGLELSIILWSVPQIINANKKSSTK